MLAAGVLKALQDAAGFVEFDHKAIGLRLGQELRGSLASTFLRKGRGESQSPVSLRTVTKASQNVPRRFEVMLSG